MKRENEIDQEELEQSQEITGHEKEKVSNSVRNRKFYALMGYERKQHAGEEYKLKDGTTVVVNDISKERVILPGRISRLMQIHGPDKAMEILDKERIRSTEDYRKEKIDFINKHRNGYLDPMEYLYNVNSPVQYIEEAERVLKEAIKNKEYNPDYVITKEESIMQQRNRTLFVKKYGEKHKAMEKKRKEEEAEARWKEQKRLDDEALREEMKQYREELRQESLEKLRKRKESDAQVLDDMLNPNEDDIPKVWVDHQRESRVVGDYRDSLLEHVPEELEKNMRLWLDYKHDKYRKDRAIRGEYLEYLDGMKGNIPGLVSEYQQFREEVYREVDVNLGRLKEAEGKRVEDFKEDAMTKYLIEDQKKNIMSAVSLNRRINELLWSPRG